MRFIIAAGLAAALFSCGTSKDSSTESALDSDRLLGDYISYRTLNLTLDSQKAVSKAFDRYIAHADQLIVRDRSTSVHAYEVNLIISYGVVPEAEDNFVDVGGAWATVGHPGRLRDLQIVLNPALVRDAASERIALEKAIGVVIGADDFSAGIETQLRQTERLYGNPREPAPLAPPAGYRPPIF